MPTTPTARSWPPTFGKLSQRSWPQTSVSQALGNIWCLSVAPNSALASVCSAAIRLTPPILGLELAWPTPASPALLLPKALVMAALTDKLLVRNARSSCICYESSLGRPIIALAQGAYMEYSLPWRQSGFSGITFVLISQSFSSIRY